ncbi:formyltetrahydrofolate deformylase [Streptomyces sp. NBC_01016]|uniref:formyltetrahydrofolate deformylase n=1 Tax=Streptomyces sp. NBC_01016 TaxID=2903720 RepID=UPI002251BCED|nr:formyltetrahydrofolate deformylase [Streptomyces sp. NBC_01016]MCX4835496.1 formyltetrahydrofolate deformylase [Streptomyces sp. NBC_01016]
MTTTRSARTDSDQYILTLNCPARPGIVHAVTAFLVGEGCDITEHQQFDDTDNDTVFLRTSFTAPAGTVPAHLEERFAATAETYAMDWRLRDAAATPRVLVMVSKFDHCLADLLYRWRSGTLDGDIALVVSNHPDLREQAEQAGVEFLHVPVTRDTKAGAEEQLLRLVDEHAIDLVVLARYMQILSDDLCKALEGRAINIHHSFLPSFAGAKPYHQAHARGVKLVGATAHYVTGDLDEGPIIEQEVIRVDHRQSARELVLVGRDAERVALARAVNWHCQNRVLLHGNRTVVFN